MIKTILLLYLLIGLVDATITLFRWQYHIKETYDEFVEKVAPLIVFPFIICLIEEVLFYIFLWPVDLYERIKHRND